MNGCSCECLRSKLCPQSGCGCGCGCSRLRPKMCPPSGYGCGCGCGRPLRNLRPPICCGIGCGCLRPKCVRKAAQNAYPERLPDVCRGGHVITPGCAGKRSTGRGGENENGVEKSSGFSCTPLGRKLICHLIWRLIWPLICRFLGRTRVGRTHLSLKVDRGRPQNPIYF